MIIIKYFFLLSVTSLSESNIAGHNPLIIASSDINVNPSDEHTIDKNSSLVIISNSNSTLTTPKTNDNPVVSGESAVYNNNSVQSRAASDTVRGKFHYGPQYETNLTFIDSEKVRVVFSLFSISTLEIEKNLSGIYDSKVNKFPTMLLIPSCSIQSIYSLKYFLFTVREYKTNKEEILSMDTLNLTSSPSQNYRFFSNSLLLVGLDPVKKYTVCIYYYQRNISTQLPELFICQDIMHEDLKHSVHGLLFVVTQYSIILGILFVLQGLFSVRKRRLAHIVHQHLVNKAQRLRLTLSSVSLIRQSVSVIDDTRAVRQNNAINGYANNEKNKLKKRIISSPAIVLSEPSVPLNKSVHNSDENEPFIKLPTGKNHVQFLLGLDEESENEEDDDNNNQNENMTNDTTFKPPLLSVHSEPYGDQTDALLSMAHILDSNKPWLKYSQDTIP